MHITIIALGTRGDAQPAITLGNALQALGHQVRLLASANFRAWIESHGLEAAVSRVDVQAVMNSAGGLEWSEQGTNPIKQMRVMGKLIDQYGMDMAQDALNACQGADAIISQFTSIVYAPSIAEKLGARHICFLLQPTLVPSRSGWAMVNAPLPDRKSWFNYLFGKWIIHPSIWNIYGGITNRFRQTVLGLQLQSRQQHNEILQRTPFILAYSPHVVPPPDDWPACFHTTGFIFLDEQQEWQPASDLLHFLDAGQPPVCIGFGSMPGRDMEAFNRLLVEAVNRSGQRAVLLSGWAGLGRPDLPEHIFGLESAPHSWLFPRVSAVVHHGGAGSTAASLRAGKPTVIIPHLADQPFWGKRVELLGAGPKAIPRPKLTAARLADAIRQAVQDPAMSRKAAELGEKIRHEDGLGNALAVLNRYLFKTPNGT
jgi:sterol 3beta-glucosyltransferase